MRENNSKKDMLFALVILITILTMIQEGYSLTLPYFSAVDTHGGQGYVSSGHGYGTPEYCNDEGPSSTSSVCGSKWWCTPEDGEGCSISIAFGDSRGWAAIEADPEEGSIGARSCAMNYGGPTDAFALSYWGVGSATGYLRKVVRVEPNETFQYGDPVDIQANISIQGDFDAYQYNDFNKIRARMHLWDFKFYRDAEWLQWGGGDRVSLSTAEDVFFMWQNTLLGYLIYNTDSTSATEVDYTDNTTIQVNVGDIVVVETWFQVMTLLDNPGTCLCGFPPVPCGCTVHDACANFINTLHSSLTTASPGPNLVPYSLDEESDSDGDGILDYADNCPDDYNPDQFNSDIQGGGDICDPCPADDTDTCDQSGAGAGVVDSNGGTVSNQNGSCTIEVAPGAVDTETTFSITCTGSNYELDTDVGDTQSVLGVQLEPGGVPFNQPVTVRLAWEDSNNDGVVDGTTFNEADIFVVKDGEVITNTCISGACSCLNPPDLCSGCRCDLDTNYFETDVTGFSEFVLAVPLDTDRDRMPDNYAGITDNCPTTPNPLQEDTYPPGGNGIGNACECESDFDCDGDVDTFDIDSFLTDFGRNSYETPCESGNPCNGDFSCDGDVDTFDMTTFLEDFGRGKYVNPCPACVVEDWCVYP